MSVRTRSGRRIGSSIALGALAGWIVALPLGGATIPAGTLLDDFTTNGNCTLREALYAAQLNVPIDACPPGDSEVRDVVSLDSGTYVLALGPLLVANSDVTVLGRIPVPNGPSYVTAVGSRIFDVSGGASLVLQRLWLFEGNAGTGVDAFGGAVRAQHVHLELVDVVVAGNHAQHGGGVWYEASGDQELVIRRTRFEGNLALAPAVPGPYGGALFIDLSGDARATVVDSVFQENGSVGTGGSGASGAAIFANVTSQPEAPSLVLRRTSFLGNALDCSPDSQGDAAVRIWAALDVEVTLADLRFAGNDADADCHGDSTTALHLMASGASVTLDRARFEDEDEGELRNHIFLHVSNDGDLTATNLLLANGPETGVDLVSQHAQSHLGHLTVTGHFGYSAKLHSTFDGVTTLDNSILWGNGTDQPQVSGDTTLRSNLLGADPLFVDPANGDFGLQAGSPAIGAGDRTLPTVRFADAAHAPRIFGTQTDAGAYERRGIFADDFELGDATDWSVVRP